MDEFRMLSSDVVEDNEEIIEQSLRPQEIGRASCRERV